MRPASVALLLTLAGCATTSSRQHPAEAPPLDPQSELHHLEAAIALHRRSLPDPPEEAAPRREVSSVPAAQAASAPAPGAPPATEIQAEARPAAKLSGQAAGGAPADAAASPAGALRVADRCRSIRRAIDTICDLAARICHLADQLGDPPARASCSRARSDCADARRRTGGCA